MSIYRPRLVPQDDGSRWQWENCTCASAAMALDRHTLGRIRTTGSRMRLCQDDRVGGTDLHDMAVAWDRCWNKYLEVHLDLAWTTFISQVRRGKGAIVLGWYGKIPARYRGQYSASFGHAVYINEVRPSDGALLMYDPLASKPVWVPQIYIKQFAGAMRFSNGETLGYGRVQAAFTRDTVASTPPPAPKLTLRYGGVKITPNLFEAKVAAKQRRSPYIRTDNVIRTVAKGTDFRAYQKTTKGTSVNGDRTWYGNLTGTVWMHRSILKDI